MNFFTKWKIYRWRLISNNPKMRIVLGIIFFILIVSVLVLKNSNLYAQGEIIKNSAKATFINYEGDSHISDSNRVATIIEDYEPVNIPPIITYINDYPVHFPIGSGVPVNFQVGWEDLGDRIKIFICETREFDFDTAQCKQGHWCSSEDFTAVSPASCQYTGKIPNYQSIVNHFYAYICDDGGLCSKDSVTGLFVVRKNGRVDFIIDSQEFELQKGKKPDFKKGLLMDIKVVSTGIVTSVVLVILVIILSIVSIIYLKTLKK